MTDLSDLPILNSAEARVLGCLMEKKELTPDVYPLTLNALQAAANQKTSREPVMAMEAVEVNRALASLEQKGLARRALASRVERFEHLAGRQFSLTQSQCSLVAMLLLRGPQTFNELFTRTERMGNFRSSDDARQELDLLIGRRPPLIKEIGRAPGQREDRFAHLLSGDVQAAPTPAPAPLRMSPVSSDMEARIAALEEQVAALTARLDELAGR